ncbi:hypothetical protein LTR64_008703 [Lithohypha guttulata]|uniref:uncharacterized protein n=1 Tax=Lithohypha guttulata TaxID=1690604 RepID=UPI00315DA9E6
MALDGKRDLAGKHFAFFGGTAGIGQAAAEVLAGRGANIAVVGRSKEAGDATVQTLQSKGAASAIFIQGDLATAKGASDTAAKVQQWSGILDGIVHSAMSAFSGKEITSDGLEFAFALQYEARVIIDALLLDNLAASRDGRIVHIAGAVPASMMPDLDDLQFEKSKFSFWKAILGTHNLGFMFIQEARQKWGNRPISITAVCVGSTKTKAMADPKMPFLMRVMGYFGTTPDISARNVVNIMTATTIPQADRFGIMWDPKKTKITEPAFPKDKAEKLWKTTKNIAEQRGVTLTAF